MTNWQEKNYPFKDFNEAKTELWKINGFDKGQTKNWLEAGLKSEDFDFAKWLVEKKMISPDTFLDNYDYEEIRNDWIDSNTIGKGETVTIQKAIIEKDGKKIEIWDTNNLPKFDREKEKRKLDLLTELDKGKKMITTIAEIDEMYWGDLRFIIDKDGRFRTWDGHENNITFFANNVEPYNTWKVGDTIEIDIERLNKEKFTLDPLKSQDIGIIKLIKKSEDNKEERISRSKKANQNAKLKEKVKVLEKENEELKNQLRKKEEIIKQLREENKYFSKENSEFMEQQVKQTIFI